LILGNNIKLQDVPYFEIEGNIVWGATAMMLSEFAAIVETAQARSLVG
jgi:hypothetical protein